MTDDQCLMVLSGVKPEPKEGMPESETLSVIRPSGLLVDRLPRHSLVARGCFVIYYLFLNFKISPRLDMICARL
jgi:hypothetical protein